MKMTLLELVQDILNDLDSDEVNSIDDTTESAQVAQIVKSTYFAIINDPNRDWPHLRKGIQLEPPATLATPTHMTLPENVKELSFINYNKAKLGETRKLFQSVRWLEPDDFLRVLNSRNTDNSNIDIITDPSGIELLVRSDKAPEFYTSFDDSVVVFDSYDISVDDTLQQVKVQAQAYVLPTWSPVDEFIPDLPDKAFTYLLEEAKSRCSLKLKQTQDVKAEQEARKQNRGLSRNAWRVHGGITYPNYGRRGANRSDPTFKQ